MIRIRRFGKTYQGAEMYGKNNPNIHQRRIAKRLNVDIASDAEAAAAARIPKVIRLLKSSAED